MLVTGLLTLQNVLLGVGPLGGIIHVPSDSPTVQIVVADMLAATVMSVAQDASVSTSIESAGASGDVACSFKLTASEGLPEDRFGVGVAVSGDFAAASSTLLGRNQAVGGQTGFVYVFHHQGVAWIEAQKLEIKDVNSGFYLPIAMSGNRLIVGAVGSQAAYMFRSDSKNWIEEARLTPGDLPSVAFGWSVSIDSDVAAVGAYEDDNERGDDAGSVYVFRRDALGWTQEAKLIASDGNAHDRFGWSVCVSGDRLVAAAAEHDHVGDYSGSVYVFRYNGASWTEEVELIGSDTHAQDLFGFSVGLYGDFLAVGARDADPAANGSGAVYVFQRLGTGWTEMSKLIASDAAAGDQFGASVSIRGDRIIVGANRADPGGIDAAGAAYVFRRVEENWLEEAKLTALDGANEDEFASSISTDGTTIITGAYLADNNFPAGSNFGAAYVYALIRPSNIMTSVEPDGRSGCSRS